MRLCSFAAAFLALAAIPARAADLPFEVLSAQLAAGELGLTFAQDPQALEQMWASHRLKGQPPRIDFNKWMVVAWMGGGMPCERFDLTQVVDSPTGVALKIKHTETGYAVCSTVYTPFILVTAVPRTTKPFTAETFDAAEPFREADLPFKILSAGKVAGQVQADVSEARDRQELQHIWSRLGLKGTVPKVDFKQRMVAAWVGGGSACDKYVLTRASEGINAVLLTVKHVRPPPGRMCIMIFSPSALVASIPRTNKDIKVDVQDERPAASESAR